MRLLFQIPSARLMSLVASRPGHRWRIVVLSLACVAGCEPPTPPSPEDLGRVVVDPEKVPGGQKPFTLPELKTAPPGAEKSPRDGGGDNHQGHDH
jgi:hypothetical protein